MSGIRLSILLLVGLSLALFACEPIVTIVVYNNTNDPVQIFDDGETIGTVVPGGEIRYSVESRYSDYSVIAKDTSGKVVFTHNFTRNDLQRKKTYPIIIPANATQTANPGQ